MLHGLIIDKMVEGGPAHSSGLLEQGDEILKVDGKEVTEDTFPGIVIGSDAPVISLCATSGVARCPSRLRASGAF